MYYNYPELDERIVECIKFDNLGHLSVKSNMLKACELHTARNSGIKNFKISTGRSIRLSLKQHEKVKYCQ